MSMDAIKKVTDAEQSAQSRYDEALAEQRRQIALAKKDGAEKLEERRYDAEQRVKSMLAEAEQSAGQKNRQALEQAEAECSQEMQDARKRLDTAVTFITERVVND